MKRILVTGANGYLAYQIIMRCLNDNIPVLAVTSNVDSATDKYGIDERIEIVSNDSLFRRERRLYDIATVIHTAFCRKSDGELLIKSLDYQDKLIQRVIEDKVRGIINISSQSVYNNAEDIQLPTEDEPMTPAYLYSFAKAASEKMLEYALRGRETAYTNIRLASLIGPSITIPKNIIYKFVENALQSEKIVIRGGHQRFSFIDVRDAAEAIVRMTKTPYELWMQAYNLGPEHQVSIKELSCLAVECAVDYNREKSDVEVIEEDLPLNAGMNNERLYNQLNWKPKYSIADTIKDTADYILRKNEQ